MSEFLSALAALPSIIAAFKGLVGYLEDEFGPDWAERLQDLRQASVTWNAAKTQAERTNAATLLSRAFNSHK